jgi:putative holliday junction resolvase
VNDDDEHAARGTVLAFDYGERFTGVAVGELETKSAHPLTTIDARATDARFAAIAKIVDEWRPALAVVGVPLSMAGERHALTDRAERFARQLEGRFKLATALVDERLTSADAGATLAALGRGGKQGKDDTHALAAQLILRAYFDDPSSRR